MYTRQINQIMRWNMKPDAIEATFSEMKGKIMPYRVQDYVVANLI